MTTNIIEINLIDEMGLRDTDYIVCDDNDKARDIFYNKIEELIKDRMHIYGESEIKDTMQNEDYWITNNNGDNVFTSDDFWVTFVENINRV